MGPFIATIPDWFSPRIAAQVAAYFALRSGGQINILKATKLIYLADRKSMDEKEHPITGDNFVSMPFGPVNTFTYSIMRGNASRGLDEWRQYFSQRVENDLPLQPDIEIKMLDELSSSDIRTLSETWDQFRDIDRFALAEWTHKFCPEWRDPHGSSLPIDFATVYKRLKKSDPIDLAEQIQAERSLFLELTSASRAGGPDLHSSSDGGASY